MSDSSCCAQAMTPPSSGSGLPSSVSSSGEKACRKCSSQSISSCSMLGSGGRACGGVSGAGAGGPLQQGAHNNRVLGETLLSIERASGDRAQQLEGGQV